MTEEAFKNSSKIITIYRAESFLGKAQVGLDEYYALSNKPIGSFWDAKGMSKVGTGLDWDETRILLPLVIDAEKDDKDFKVKVINFYHEIDTKVPYREGVKLNIGLKDNSKPLSTDNLPLVPMDYIRYRHARRHPWVALSLKEAQGNQLKTFYISDPEELRKESTSARKTKELAMEQYLILTKEKEERIDDVLAVLKQDPRGFRGKDEKLDYLESLVNHKEEEIVANLLKVATDKSIQMKGLLAKLVQTNILKMVGSRYMVTETDAIFADGEEDAVLSLAEEKNAQLLTVFKAQLQEKMKAKVQRNNK